MEEVELHFNYLALHDKCWEVLRGLRILDHEFRKACEGRPDFIEGEGQLPLLVGLIFRAAAGKTPGWALREGTQLLTELECGCRRLLGGQHQIVVYRMRQLRIPT